MLAEELASVDSWPESLSQVHFSRDANDCSGPVRNGREMTSGR